MRWTVLAFLATAAHAQWKTPWAYEGPKGAEHWGDLDPDYALCKNGKAQSPIDIRQAEKSAGVPAVRFEYRPGPLIIVNNGYTAVRVDYPKGNGNFLIAGDRRFELTQFHFHRPSEEIINGKPSAMGIHFMLQAADGRIAGVAVLLKRGKPNPAVEELWKHMPPAPGPAKEIPGVSIDPAALLPHDLAYYTYEGSVTAPPCSEGVVWYILITPVEVSPAQIEAFARLYPHDVRPPQPLNGRVVKQSR